MNAPVVLSSGPRDADLAAHLKQLGGDAGLHTVGVCDAAPFVDTRRILEERAAAGFSDTMQFTYRNPERSTTPTRIVPEAKSLVVAARSYPSWAQHRVLGGVEPEAPTGRIASYAWRDHYGELRAGLEVMAAALRELGWVARVVADDNALVDRAAAVRAGLGWSGKNSNVLIPSAGSFFVLGSVVTDAPLAEDEPLGVDCGTCRRCLDGCPTDAIVAPGVVDARRCLAWLLQREGMFPIEFREALGDRLYGCDECQEVCPPSRQNPAQLSGDEVVGAQLGDLLEADDAEIARHHGRWYIPRRDMDYVRRNALIALANVAAQRLANTDAAADVVARYLQHENPMLRAHAVWAAGRIDRPALARIVADDPSEDVQAEIARL